MNNSEWAEVVNAEQGHIFDDYYEEGVRVIIVRGPACLCVYCGIPEDHPLAGFSYDDIPLSCHGGLTFSDKGDGKYRPTGFYWYGWDYGHAGDMSTYDGTIFPNGEKWTAKKVKADIYWSVVEFKKLMKLAEDIKSKKS